MPNNNGFLPTDSDRRGQRAKKPGGSASKSVWPKRAKVQYCHAHRGRSRAGRGLRLRPRRPRSRCSAAPGCPTGGAAYRVRSAPPTEEVDAGVFTLRAPWGLDALAEADTIILPGWPIPRRRSRTRSSRRCGGRLRTAPASPRSAPVPSSSPPPGCWTGCAPPRTGLRPRSSPAGTPASRWTPDVLFVDNGQFLTSAGAAAGLDLCLHMIRRDHGSAVAADAARLSVMPLERDGGQAQFIVHEQPGADGSSLEPLLAVDGGQRPPGAHPRRHRRPGRDEHPHAQPPFSGTDRHDPAAVAAPRPDPPGAVPARDHRARRRPDRIQVGFGSPTSFRDRFKRLVGTSPHAYRHAFQGSDQSIS